LRKKKNITEYIVYRKKSAEAVIGRGPTGGEGIPNNEHG